jgi:hypothetical protein
MLRERDHPAPPAPLDVDWMLFAACSELEVRESDRLFFCGQGQSRLANQARAICAGCEVQGECLEFALRHPEECEFRGMGRDHTELASEAARTIAVSASGGGRTRNRYLFTGCAPAQSRNIP